MNKLYAISLLTVGLSISAFAADKVPSNVLGGQTDPVFAGASTCEITNSTSTRPILCATGAGVVLDIVGSSVASTDQIVLRDSNTPNTSSTRLYTTDLTALGKFPRIMPQFKNGLSVNANVAPTAAGGNNTPAWTIVFRALPQ